MEIERRAGPLVAACRTIRGADGEGRPVGGIGVGALVWPDTTGGRVAVSPERPQEFLDRLRAHLELLR